MPLSHLNNKNGCPKCTNNKKLTTEEFINNSNNIHHNKYDYSIVNYINNSTKIKIICPIHGIFEQTPNNHVNLKQGCPECFGNKKSNMTKFLELSKKIHNDMYDYSLTDYDGMNKKVKIICLKHGVFEQYATNHIHNSCGCPSCNESKGEKEICRILNEKNINYIRQHKFDKCRDKNPLPFDFYLPEYNTCIEFDGKQHFIPIEYLGGKINFEITKKHDQIKNNYCKNNNIHLLRIKYNDYIIKKLEQI